MSLDQFSQVIAKWQGLCTTAKVWEYKVSHRKLVIRLESSERPKSNLHIYCMGVRRMSLPTEWGLCDIKVVRNIDEGGYLVEDRIVDLRIECDLVEAVENCNPIY